MSIVHHPSEAWLLDYALGNLNEAFEAVLRAHVGGDTEVLAAIASGVTFGRLIEPGEIVIISDEGVKSIRTSIRPGKSFCIFEFIYFARPDSTFFGHNVYLTRKAHGRRLAEEALQLRFKEHSLERRLRESHLMRLQGGSVRVESEVGVGTRFELDLPSPELQKWGGLGWGEIE